MHLRIHRTVANAVVIEAISNDGSTTDLITGLTVTLGGAIKVAITTDLNKLEPGHEITVDA